MAAEFNAALRRRRPRFEPYICERIRGTDREVRFGPDLLDGDAQDWDIAGGAQTEERPGTVLLESQPCYARAKAETEHPGHAYLVEVTFEVVTGSVFFKLQDTPIADPTPVAMEFLPADPHVCWYYAYAKPSNGQRTVRAVVYPRTKDTYFIAGVTAASKATVFDVKLRRAHVPAIATEYRLPPPERRSAGPPSDGEGRRRLDALGYLD